MNNKYLNIPGSFIGTGNTGATEYTIIPRLIVGAILTSKTKKYSEADMATFLTKLQNDTLAVGTARIRPIFRFKELSDGSSDLTIATSGYGDNQPVRDGKYKWTFTMSAATGLYNNQQLRKLNGGSYRAFFIDDNGLILGTYDEDGNFMGAELEYFYAKLWKANDGSKPAAFMTEFAMANADELNENIAVYTPSFSVEQSVKGLLSLELTKILTATGKATIGIRTEGDKIDMYPLYSTELAVVALWKVINVATGAAVVPTTVATNAGASGWDVSLAAGTYQIGLASPDALSTGNVGGAPESGYEGLPIIITIT